MFITNALKTRAVAFSGGEIDVDTETDYETLLNKDMIQDRYNRIHDYLRISLPIIVIFAAFTACRRRIMYLRLHQS